MEEISVDISDEESNTPDRYLREPFDYVITVCDDANAACPFRGHDEAALVFTGSFASRGLEEERLAVFRSVRGALRSRMELELTNQG